MTEPIDQNLRRARAWSNTLPAGSRPDDVDIEFFVRLGVRDPHVMTRLLWNNVETLGRHFTGLLSALDDPSDEPSKQSASVKPKVPFSGSSGVAPDGSAEAVAEPAEVVDYSSDDPRYAELVDYVGEQRAADHRLPWNDDWISRALADPEALVNGLPSRVAREHRDRLNTILLGSGGPSSRRRGAPGAEPPTSGGFTTQPDPHAKHSERHVVSITSQDASELNLDWPSAPYGQVAHFKVIAGVSGKVPQLFDDGNVVADTDDASVVDEAPIYGGGWRHYAVWAYLGSDDESAARSTPTLWARGTALQPVEQIKMTVSGDDVSGTWEVAEGIERVEVYRLSVPNDIPSNQVPEAYIQSGELAGQNRTGFVDSDLSAGEYEYRIYSFASVAGQNVRSVPIVRTTTVTVPVPGVEGFQVEVSDGTHPSFDISWLPPTGQVCVVEIHLRGEGAPPGIEGRQLDGDALLRNGFTEDSRRNLPQTVRDGGRVGITVDWPDSLDRVHITPVTRIGSAYKVGSEQVRNRVGAIENVRLIERVDEQFLTFKWPSGASYVAVTQGPLDGSGDQDSWPLLREISRFQHEQYGGVHLPPLPAEGCRLGLVGMANHGGAKTLGERSTIPYPGLTRIDYKFVETFTTEGRFKKAEVSAGWRLAVRPNRNLEVQLSLVRLKDRLPLHHGDGEEVRLEQVRIAAGEERTVWEGLRVGAPLWGFVRLFVKVSDEQQLGFAVLDPAREFLEWSAE